jgi:hypothetical protein
MVWELEDRDPPIRFLIHDNDQSFTEAFDTVFRAEGIKVIHTPYRAPNANAYAERWIRSFRDECLDKLLIINQAHLRRVMREFVAYHNAARPHQGIDQQIPVPGTAPIGTGPIRCCNVLGSIIHDCRVGLDLPADQVFYHTGFGSFFLPSAPIPNFPASSCAIPTHTDALFSNPLSERL